MRKSSILSLVFITLFMFSLADLSGNGTLAIDLGQSLNSQNQVSEAGGTYIGNGAPLDVSFSGTFTNSSSWSQTTTTLSSDFTSGTSFAVSNSSTVTWTAYILVSPPADVNTLGFTVDYNETEWRPTSLTNPIGVVMIYTTDWWYDTGLVHVSESAVDTHGVWKLEFTAMNHLFDLELGLSGGSLGTTSNFVLNDEMLFRSTSSWITSASTMFVLTDPTGSEWHSATNTTSGSSTHVLQSFQYRKDITIDRSRHLGTSVNNFPVMIDITSADFQTDVQSDGDDILFVSGGNILSHQIESFDQASGHLEAWVKTNLTGSTNTVISMYYGNPLVGNMEAPEDVWTESFAAVWHLDEAATAGQSTATHYDSTSGSYDGSQNGNFDDTGAVGDGQHFDGSDDQVVISASEALNPNGDVEISGWFKLDVAHTAASTTTQVLFTKYMNGDNDMHIALVGNGSAAYSNAAATDGSLVFKTENDNAQMYKWTARTNWQAGVWFYFSCFMDASTPANNKVYVRAIDDTGGTSGGVTYANVSFSADWGIGGGLIDQVTGNLAWFDGVMDEVRVSSIANGRAGAWRAAEWSNLNDPATFYSVGSEIERTSPDPQIKKTVDGTALAGSWIATAYYNDSGSSVSYRVGMYERVFNIKQASTLSISAPTDAVGDSITEATIGDMVYVQVELTGGGPVAEGATVTTNWTIYGSGTNLQFHDEGGGYYGLSLDTSQLESNIRWRLNIQSSHPSYTDASTTLFIDLSHDTTLGFTNVDSTPTGFDFTATLVYTDTFDGSPITGATITFANGTAVIPVAEANGQYNISFSTTGLSAGAYSYIFNATKPGSLVDMASVEVMFILRPHYTAVSVSGDLVTPSGSNTPLSVVLVDLDTGGLVDISNVASITFTPSSHGPQIFGTYNPTLVTNTWSVAAEDVTLTVSMSSSDYYAPSSYDFQVTIRKHYVSATVIGNLVTPYGNNTPLTVVLTDLDTGGSVDVSAVDSIGFTSSYSPLFDGSPSSYNMLLLTGDDSWAVGPESVTLAINMLGSSIYQNPVDFVFTITIRSMSTYLYNAPSDLIFPNGDDFLIHLQYNISEIGQYYGDFIPGIAPADFTVTNTTYTYPATFVYLGNGNYSLTIAAAFFPEGRYTITVTVDPSNANYASTQLVITFDYRPTRSDLTANQYTVSTPYNFDVTVVLFYEDLDRSLGITTGTITSLDATVTPTHTGGGYYDVIIDVSGLAVGAHVIDLDADASGYDSRTVTITVVITKIHTDLEPSLISLDMPVGNTVTFYIDFNDLDNGIPISSATRTHNWTVQPNVVITWTGTTWEVNFTTTGSDTLGTYIVWFNFAAGSNYDDGYVEIEVVVRSHVTIFNLVSAIEPTPYNGIVNISLRYYDWDSKAGITDDSNILSSIWNQTHWITHTLVNDGSGFYTLQIDATIFSQGVQNFDIYFDWTGPVQQFEDKMTIAAGNIIGVDSQLTLLQSSEPTPYLGSLLYIFNYASTGGSGITNTSGDVHIYVSFQGESVDLGLITIDEVDPVLEPGSYSISFSTTIFGKTGLIYMNVYINWSAGVAPYYTNRFDVISVRVLPRDTVLSVVPPTPQAYGENATFSFTFEDVTGGASLPIDNSSAMTISLSLADYTLTWNGGTHEFTVSFNTSQFGAPLGQKSFTLDVTWTGTPYYNNRTGHTVFITVTARQTVLDYQSPAPTAYLDSVTFIVEWTDVTNGFEGISGATVILFDSATPIPGGFYTVTPLGGGQYEIELNTTYYAVPASYPLTVALSTGDFFILAVSSMRTMKVFYRPSLLSAEPIGPAPYNSSLVYILDFQDRLTLDVIDEDTLVTFEILNASWTFNVVWYPAFQYYEMTIETYDQVGLVVGLEYTLQINATYASQSPFYGSDDTYIFFELRTRSSDVVMVESPDPTPYLENVDFRVQYLDSDSGSGIVADSLTIWKGVAELAAGVDYTLMNQGNGYYLISLDTTALDGLDYTTIQVRATWTTGAPYHDNANLDIDVYVTRREANIEIVTPPTQAKYLDNVTYQFVYRDLGSGSVITTISSSDIQIWAGGILLTAGQYVVTGAAGTFSVSINSTILGAGLVSNYNVTVFVDWNDGSAPFYFDDATIVRVSTRERLMTYTVLPREDTAFGELLNLSFTLLDADSNNPVIDADIAFDLQSGGLVEGVDFWVVKGIGVYTIRIDTTALGPPDTYLFDLDITWTGLSPYYLNLATISTTGIVNKIDTILIPQQDLVEVQWSASTPITLTYQSLLDSSLIDGADIMWESSFEFAGSAGFLGAGQYQASIDTATYAGLDVGTYVLTFTIENLTAYKSAVAYVTLVITALDSELTLIDYTNAVNRGAALPITIYLTDGSFIPIADEYVTQAIATLDGLYSFDLLYNGTPGYYTVVLPENDVTATKRSPGTDYAVIITAFMRNYYSAASSFSFIVNQESTEVQLGSQTSEDMTFVYTEYGLITVDVVLPDRGDAPFWNGTVQWLISDLGLFGNFTNDYGNGTYSVYLNTTLIGYGIVPIILKFNPWSNMALYASSSKLITAAITRISTSVTPPSGREFYWGWSGYLEFIYWSESFEAGIPDADVTLTLPGLESSVAIDLHNGTYLVYLDTSLLRGSTSYLPLTVSFTKANHLEANAIIQIRILEVPTEISVESVDYSPAFAGVLDDLINLQIPIGDSMAITFWYNDTDNSEGFVGGIAGASATINSILRGPTLDSPLNVTIINLGGGLYQVIFDTTDTVIAAEVDPEEYRLYIEMALDNHTTTDILFRIEIIEIPTELVITNAPPTWTFVNGDPIILNLRYRDTWHDVGITGASLVANASAGAPITLHISEGTSPGVYHLEIQSGGILFTNAVGTFSVTIDRESYTIGILTQLINLEQNQIDGVLTLGLTYGIPIILVFALIGGAYLRVWSVPKRLRQINSQIKALRKGKIPKPVGDAKSRQELITDLFNDTYETTGITRTVEQIPEDSIPVEVPELGELLIQLSILTNLNQQELDEFKADIAKMKISEQAAFVKEVIMQEAIRAARRDGKTVEEVIDEVQKDAVQRLAGEEGRPAPEGAVEEDEEPYEEPVFLTPKEDEPEPESEGVITPEEPMVPEEDISFSSDQLSPFEIEELRKELVEKGVPPSEIDILLKQATELPRDLIEELIRSLDAEKLRKSK